MPFYDVLTEAWIPDAQGRTTQHFAGETVSLPSSQAEYLLLSGQIAPHGSYPVPPPLMSSDVIILRRNGIERVIASTELVAFFAPLGVGGAPADTTPPTILTGLSQTVAENQALSLSLTANETVTWAIVGGADAARFSLSGATLSMPPKDYEAPTDANGNNVYIVQVRATDTAGNVSAPLTISVSVTDVFESITPAPFAASLATLVSIGAI